MLNPERVKEFSTALRGRVVQPGDTDYDASRKVYNAMIDRLPGLIVYCRDVADVMHSVNFARAQSLLLAVRGKLADAEIDHAFVPHRWRGASRQIDRHAVCVP